MRAYSAVGSNVSGTATKTLVNVIASANVRPRIFDFNIGCSATPSDQSAKFGIQRFTAVGTAGSNPTPQAFDPADVAAVATAGAAHSAEPTYTAGANLMPCSINQRGAFRWVAVPGCELVAPATANNGLGLQMISATAATVFDGVISWFE